MAADEGAWVDEFARRGHLTRYAKGQMLFTEGATDGSVFAIRSGRIRISVVTPAGRNVVLGLVEPGAILGDLTAIDGRPRAATATALDVVEAFVVGADVFNTMLREVPGLAADLLHELAGRVRESSSLRADREAGDLTVRVARCLARLADRAVEFSHGGPVTIELSQDDLAGLVGGTREEVNRAVSKLRSAGAVATTRGRIEVLDPAALHTEAAWT